MPSTRRSSVSVISITQITCTGFYIWWGMLWEFLFTFCLSNIPKVAWNITYLNHKPIFKSRNFLGENP